jgi:hypothetical protein
VAAMATEARTRKFLDTSASPFYRARSGPLKLRFVAADNIRLLRGSFTKGLVTAA